MMKQVAFLLAVVAVHHIEGYGRFMKPPNRSSIWRVPEFAHLNPPTNYDDNQLYCGAVHQTEIVGGNCGVCGDPWTQVSPRDNEIGGKWDRGIIVAEYSAGEIIDIEVDLNTAHKGFMQFRLCANGDANSQECFNQNLLQFGDGSGTDLPVSASGWYKTTVRLPVGVTCERCVIQWNFRAGNNPGPAQETFRGCSDIRIR